MKGLDLRKFTKLKADAKTTTLKHPDGHTITLAHKALSPANQKELHALPFADGGEIPGGNGSPSIDASKVGGDVTTSGDPIVNAVSNTYNKLFGQSKAKGGMIQDPTQSHLMPGDRQPNRIEKQVVGRAKGRMYEDGGYVDITDSGDPLVKAVSPQKPESPTHEGEGYSSRPLTRPSPANAKDEAYKKSVADFNAKMAGYAQGGEIQKQQGIEEQITRERGGRKMYADGDYVTPNGDTSDQIAADAAQQAPKPDVPTSQSVGNYVGNIARGTAGDVAGAFSRAGQMIGAPLMSGAQGFIQGIRGQPATPISTADEDTQQREPSAVPEPQGPANMPKQQPQDTSGGVPGSMSQGLQMQISGLQNQYQAEKQAGAERAKVEEQAIAQQQQQAQSYDNRMNALQQERQNILSDKIDPNHLWNSKTTTDKVGTILGLLVGGFNPRGNDSVKMLDDAISRDIDAQKTNKSNALNSLTQMFGDANTAAQYHRVILNDQVAHGIDLAMAHASTPQALANLQQAKGKLMFDSGIRMAGIGAQVTLNGANPNQQEVAKALGNLRIMDPTKAKEAEQRVIPNIGVAEVPVNDKTREAFTAGQTFMQQMDQLEKFRQANRGAMFGAAADEGHRLAELARNSFRIAQGEGVFKAGSQHFNERLIPDPTDIDFFGKNKNAYGDMRTQAQRELQNSMVLHGIKPFAGSPIQPQGSSQGYQPQSAKPIKTK